LRGLLRSAADRRLAIDAIDVRSSGDTAGDRHQVVGYGAFAVG
jgi:AmmeMemoRadiSam system protein B